MSCHLKRPYIAGTSTFTLQEKFSGVALFHSVVCQRRFATDAEKLAGMGGGRHLERRVERVEGGGGGPL